MTKTEFLQMLKAHLSHLPKEQVEKAVLYYSGIIDGRMEGGMTEDKAVGLCGSAEKAALDYIQSIYSEDIKIRPASKLNTMPSYIRIPLSVLILILLLALIVAVWGVIASVIAVAVCLLLVSVAGILGGIFMCFFRAVPVGLCFTGVGIIVASILLFLFMPFKTLIKTFTSVTSFLSKKMRSLFISEVL